MIRVDRKEEFDKLMKLVDQLLYWLGGGGTIASIVLSNFFFPYLPHVYQYFFIFFGIIFFFTIRAWGYYLKHFKWRRNAFSVFFLEACGVGVLSGLLSKNAGLTVPQDRISLGIWLVLWFVLCVVIMVRYIARGDDETKQ